MTQRDSLDLLLPLSPSPSLNEPILVCYEGSGHGCINCQLNHLQCDSCNGSVCTSCEDRGWRCLHHIDYNLPGRPMSPLLPRVDGEPPQTASERKLRNDKKRSRNKVNGQDRCSSCKQNNVYKRCDRGRPCNVCVENNQGDGCIYALKRRMRTVTYELPSLTPSSSQSSSSVEEEEEQPLVAGSIWGVAE
jgi:hypothetical protein